MKKLSSYIILLAGTLLVPVGLFSQTADSLLLRDFNFVGASDAWLGGNNAAALTRWQSRNISRAELSTHYQRGGFVNYNESPRAWNTTGRVESFYRLSPRMVVYGQMTYDSFSGREMTGSAFISPHRKPFDIAEDSLTNAGKKHFDTYHLTGALGWQMWRGLAIGAKVDFTAANAAKYRDLRHKTKLMDLNLLASIYAPVGRTLSFGANYQYRRNTESVSFSTYAGNDKDYFSFINYGPWIGEAEQFSDQGFTARGSEHPFLTEYQGAGVQAAWTPLPGLNWYNDFWLAYRHGYYGRKSQYSITFMNHNSHLLGYTTRLQWRGKRQEHSVDLNFTQENLRNLRNTYRGLLNQSGASYYEYYDAVKTGNRLWQDFHVGYTARWGIVNELPLWSVQAGLDVNHRKQTGYDYPYFRHQQLTRTEGYLRAEHNLLLRNGVLSLRGSVAYAKGSGAAYEDGTFIKPSDKQKGFPQMEAFLYREYLYLTAPQYTFGGGVGYAFHFPATRMKTYINLDAVHHKANVRNAFLAGRDNTGVTLTIGCAF